MLTNLDFLQIGQQFPPKTEQKRIESYIENKKIFDGEHAEIYQEQLKRVFRYADDLYGNLFGVESYVTDLNFQRLISVKTADLLALDGIKIMIQDKTKQKDLDKILEKNDIYATAYLVALDMSRYGTGIFYTYKDGLDWQIDITQPRLWFPVVSERNVRKIKYHVLCIPKYIDEEKNNYELYCEIHERGKYTTLTLLVKNNKIVKVLEDAKVIETGMKDFAVIPVQNLTASDTIFGKSDYEVCDSLVAELIVRVSQVNKILDKFSEPNLMGPNSAIEYNHKTGKHELKLGGRYFGVNSGEKMEYLTWDAQLSANMEQIRLLLNLLYQLTEMSGTLLGDVEATKSGTPTSGIAYKHRMESTLQKLKRFRLALDTGIRKVICAACQAQGFNISENELIIEWKNSLTDEKEQAEILNIKTGGKPVVSQVRAIMMANDMTREEAEEEYARIIQEEIEANPLNVPNPHLYDEEMDKEIDEENDKEINE